MKIEQGPNATMSVTTLKVRITKPSYMRCAQSTVGTAHQMNSLHFMYIKLYSGLLCIDG